MMDTLLEVKSVSKLYRLRKGLFRRENLYALRNVSLTISKAEVLGVVGESGSGKSTLGKLILRLERPTEGNIYLKGREISALGKEYTREVSVIFQDPRNSLNPRMKVEEILEEPLLVHGIPNRKDIVRRVLERVQLGIEFLSRKPEALSGGQRQRVAIARALVLNPSLIIADEPTASLDVSVQAEIIELFKALKEEGIAFLFITHDIRVVEKLADRVAVIYGGMLMELGTKEDVLGSPLHPYTKFLLSNVPARHPRQRRKENFSEEEYSIPERGCPFAPRCPEVTPECYNSIRRSELNGRLVTCNLF